MSFTNACRLVWNLPVICFHEWMLVCSRITLAAIRSLSPEGQMNYQGELRQVLNTRAATRRQLRRIWSGDNWRLGVRLKCARADRRWWNGTDRTDHQYYGVKVASHFMEFSGDYKRKTKYEARYALHMEEDKGVTRRDQLRPVDWNARAQEALDETAGASSMGAREDEPLDNSMSEPHIPQISERTMNRMLEQIRLQDRENARRPPNSQNDMRYEPIQIPWNTVHALHAMVVSLEEDATSLRQELQTIRITQERQTECFLPLWMLNRLLGIAHASRVEGEHREARGMTGEIVAVSVTHPTYGGGRIPHVVFEDLVRRQREAEARFRQRQNNAVVRPAEVTSWTEMHSGPQPVMSSFSEARSMTRPFMTVREGWENEITPAVVPEQRTETPDVPERYNPLTPRRRAYHQFNNLP
jgi:hypothetical protein